MSDEQNLEQLTYIRRVTDLCSMLQLFALITDSDPDSRKLSRDERIALANEYAENWAKSRGYDAG
jgi:hypothetical protein